MTDGNTAGNSEARVVLVTGGAGFVGSNLVERLLREPDTSVRVFDNLSRGGVDQNLAWLRTLASHGRLDFVHGDIRDRDAVIEAAGDADEIFHLAAQVAVTTSVEDPRSDFEVNVAGTFNVLEAARLSGRQPFLLFTSTNKVYGALHEVPVGITGIRYRANDPAFKGVAEDEQLDFHSPYGCSKGAADQYVRDYARIYGLPTVVFRMSCIAGPRQFGTEDQGWVAHFLYSVLEGREITIYGNGFQVRDVLHVADLVDAMQAVRAGRSRCAGEIYNLGGGPERTVSVVEMLSDIERHTGISPKLRYAALRPGDQPLYISDTSKLTQHTGWKAQRSCHQALADIHNFWTQNNAMIARERGILEPTIAEVVREEVVA